MFYYGIVYFFIIHNSLRPRAPDKLPCQPEERSKFTNRPHSQSSDSSPQQCKDAFAFYSAIIICSKQTAAN